MVNLDFFYSFDIQLLHFQLNVNAGHGPEGGVATLKLQGI
jgi:hypothetical protein